MTSFLLNDTQAVVFNKKLAMQTNFNAQTFFQDFQAAQPKLE